VIILPLSKSIMAALGLFTFVWSWNQFLWPLIVLQSEELYTLPVGLVTLSNAFAYEPGLIMAATVLASLPLFVLFLLLQKHLINAIRVQGAVKE
jgi:multiple sugar transport system permease protein